MPGNENEIGSSRRREEEDETASVAVTDRAVASDVTLDPLELVAEAALNDKTTEEGRNFANGFAEILTRRRQEEDKAECHEFTEKARAGTIKSTDCRDYLTDPNRVGRMDPTDGERLRHLTRPGTQLDDAEIHELDQRLAKAVTVAGVSLTRLAREDNWQAAQDHLVQYSQELLYEQCGKWPPADIEHLNPAQNQALQECSKDRISYPDPKWTIYDSRNEPRLGLRLTETLKAVMEYAQDPSQCPAWFNPRLMEPVTLEPTQPGEAAASFTTTTLTELEAGLTREALGFDQPITPASGNESEREQQSTGFQIPTELEYATAREQFPLGFQGNWVHPRPIDLADSPENIGAQIRENFLLTQQAIIGSKGENRSNDYSEHDDNRVPAAWFSKKLLLAYVDPRLMDKFPHFDADEFTYGESGFNNEGNPFQNLLEGTERKNTNEAASGQDHREITYARAIRHALIFHGLVDDTATQNWTAMGHSLPRTITALNRLSEYLHQYGSEDDAGKDETTEHRTDSSPSWEETPLETYKRILDLAPKPADESNTKEHRARWPYGRPEYPETAEEREAVYPENDLDRLIQGLFDEIGPHYTGEELTDYESNENLILNHGVTAAPPTADLDHPRKTLLREIEQDLEDAAKLTSWLKEPDFDAANGKFRRERQHRAQTLLRQRAASGASEESLDNLAEYLEEWTREPGHPNDTTSWEQDEAAQLHHQAIQDQHLTEHGTPADNYQVITGTDAYRAMLLHRISQRIAHVDYLKKVLEAERAANGQ